MKFFLFAASLFLGVLAQPDISPFACIVFSAVGYALFWQAMFMSSSKKGRFFLALFWFSTIQACNLSWFASDRYVGEVIYLFLFLLTMVFGSVFAALSLLIPQFGKFTIPKALQLAALWTILEWGRLFILTGFSWNPVGLGLTATLYGMQMVSLFGVYGLSFWILFTNLLALRFFRKISVSSKPGIEAQHNPGVSQLEPAFVKVNQARATNGAPILRIALSRLKYCRSSYLMTWGLFALFPYLFGMGATFFHNKEMIKEKKPPLSVVLIQTSLYPEEKGAFSGFENVAIHPLEQWQRIFKHLKKHEEKKIDLIVLSETVVPYGTYLPIYPLHEVCSLFEKQLGTSFPEEYKKNEEKVGNAYFAQGLANHFDADIILGLEDAEPKADSAAFAVYNAAFYFKPGSPQIERYGKRVLVPLGEYIPFSFCKKYLIKYGIRDSFTPGKEAKIFKGKKASMGVSICYEETYGHLMKENRRKGANLLVNLTNDVWYPHSRLPIVHFLHGRLRAVEEGVPLVRSCNTGVTCGVDSLGRMVALLDYEKKGRDSPADALYLKLPTYTYRTLYTYLGDFTIISLSCLFLGFPLFFNRIKKK